MIHLGGVEQWFADDAGARVPGGALDRGVLRRRRRSRRPTRRGERGSTAAPGWSPRRSWRSRSCRSSTRGSRSTTGRGCCRARSRCGRRRSCCGRAAGRRCSRAGAASGVAASLKYSDGAVVIALVAAAFLSPALSFKRGVEVAWRSRALIALAVVIVTNPYLFADWGTFTHDLDRQRKFASGAAAARPARAQRLGLLRDVQPAGRSASCPACWRSRAGSRCWSRASAARRSCSAR